MGFYILQHLLTGECMDACESEGSLGSKDWKRKVEIREEPVSIF